MNISSLVKSYQNTRNIVFDKIMNKETIFTSEKDFNEKSKGLFLGKGVGFRVNKNFKSSDFEKLKKYEYVKAFKRLNNNLRLVFLFTHDVFTGINTIKIALELKTTIEKRRRWSYGFVKQVFRYTFINNLLVNVIVDSESLKNPNEYLVNKEDILKILNNNPVCRDKYLDIINRNFDINNCSISYLKRCFIYEMKQYIPKDKINEIWRKIYHYYNTNKNGKYRSYHNIDHLRNMFQELINFTLNKEHLKNPDEIFLDYEVLILAILYHDYIYEPYNNGGKENEINSVNAFKETFEKYLAKDKIKLISDLIMSTRKHEIDPILPPRFVNTNKLLLDLDLAILGTDWNQYREYVIKIRNEYSDIDLQTFIKHRSSFLKKYILKENIFQLEYFQNKYQKSALDNLKKELQSYINS